MYSPRFNRLIHDAFQQCQRPFAGVDRLRWRVNLLTIDPRWAWWT